MNVSLAVNPIDLVEPTRVKPINLIKVTIRSMKVFISKMSTITNLTSNHAHTTRPQSRQRVHRAQRTHRSASKRTSTSGSSDSDGGPSASDSSDRCILCCTPLLHFLCYSRISVVNTAAKSSIHIHYGHAIAVIITLLIRYYCAFLALFRIDMPTSFCMGSHHV